MGALAVIKCDQVGEQPALRGVKKPALRRQCQSLGPSEEQKDWARCRVEAGFSKAEQGWG